MNILLMEVTLRASWVHSLKEKRMIVKSIVQKLKNKFNISVAEVESQDVHQTIVIGIAGICSNSAQSDSTMENIITFIECSTDAEIIDIQKEDIRRWSFRKYVKYLENLWLKTGNYLLINIEKFDTITSSDRIVTGTYEYAGKT